MRIQYKEGPPKLVYIWLSREEGENSDLLDSLKYRNKMWKEQGYMPVIMESGSGNLENSMFLLMKHHYELKAKKQLNAEIL